MTTKSIEETQKELAKHFNKSQVKIMGQFLKTYNKVISSIGEGGTPTPADLYALDDYWKLIAQINVELEKLGDKTNAILSKHFVYHFQHIYDSLALPTSKTFSTLDTAAAEQAVNAIWCADGKSWSQRVWDDVDKLKLRLNEDLIYCLSTGRNPAYLEDKLMQSFGVSYRRANTIVRTEMAHIQTASAQKRYQDYGIEKYKILVDADERTCSICKKMDGKEYYLNQMQIGVNAPPFHPNDRCCIIPIL